MGNERGEWTLFFLGLTASLLGLALIYSATHYDEALHSLVWKQAAALGVGIVLCLLLWQIHLRELVERAWWLLAVGNLGFLLLLIPFGNEDGTGNKSWIALPGGHFNLQPAEFGKLLFLLLLALQLTRLGEEGGLNRLRSVLALLAHVGGLCGLLYLVSGDLGMAAIYLGLYFGMLWGAGVHPLWLGGEVAVGVGGLVLLFSLCRRRGRAGPGGLFAHPGPVECHRFPLYLVGQDQPGSLFHRRGVGNGGDVCHPDDLERGHVSLRRPGGGGDAAVF